MDSPRSSGPAHETMDHHFSPADQAISERHISANILGCNICSSLDHYSYDCPAQLWCSNCFYLGHTYKFCSEDNSTRFYWKPSNPTTLISDKNKVTHSDDTIGLDIFPSFGDHQKKREAHIPIGFQKQNNFGNYKSKSIWVPKNRNRSAANPPRYRAKRAGGKSLGTQALL